MPKQDNYQISIPEPCHEGWERMTAVGQGRFCSSCQKIVKDFSTIPDEEIIRYLLAHKNVCGRITLEQQDRVMEGKPLPRDVAATLYQRIAASLLLLTSFTGRSLAQQQKQPVQQQQARRTAVLASGDISIKGNLNYFVNAAAYRENVVLRADSLQLTIAPDEQGAFEFHLPQAYLGREVWIGTENRNPQVEVTAQKITLYTPQTNVYLRQLERRETQPRLRKEESVLEGMMIIKPDYDPPLRYTLWRRLTRPFRRK